MCKVWLIPLILPPLRQALHKVDNPMTGGSAQPRQEFLTDNLFRHRIPFSPRHMGAAFKTTQVTQRSTHTTVPYSRLLYGVLACVPGVYDASAVSSQLHSIHHIWLDIIVRLTDGGDIFACVIPQDKRQHVDDLKERQYWSVPSSIP
uniref:Secreted protein n=1 Tax=Eutreptiella gymnastica TaxID=73025 RepID=A0A7S4FYF3_9EUGL